MSITVICECGCQFEMPEGNAGLYASCPDCMRILIVPGPDRIRPVVPPEMLYIPGEPPSVSRTAIASLVFGLAFFFACFSGIPAILLGAQALYDIQQSRGRLRGRKLAIAGIVLGVIGCLATIGLAISGRNSAREAARRAQCVGNLKQIGLALHNYHEAYGSLPPAAILDKNGKPLLSWRVALLAIWDNHNLYPKFHLDEPWDSPHNLSLLDKMPSYYACPSDATLKPGMTGYQVIIGPSTVFRPDFQPLRFAEITDGLGNTILIGESRRSVPWTKPEDLSIDMSVPLNGLGSHHKNGFNVLFADGSVRFVKDSISRQALGAILTRDGRDGLSPDQF